MDVRGQELNFRIARPSNNLQRERLDDASVILCSASGAIRTLPHGVGIPWLFRFAIWVLCSSRQD